MITYNFPLDDVSRKSIVYYGSKFTINNKSFNIQTNRNRNKRDDSEDNYDSYLTLSDLYSS